MSSLFKLFVSQLNLLKEKGNMQPVVNKDADSLELDPNHEMKIYQEVLFNMDSKKIYLDSSLSLVKLSSVVGTNTTYLSNSINKHFGCNFKTLINRYRVEYCKGMLGSNPLSVPIKEIARNCGFSSVSAFYASFKKLTGISPVQYRMLMIYRNELNKVDPGSDAESY